MADIDAKQMRALLQAISADPQLQQSKDSAEDQYPEALDAIFIKLSKPTTLQNTINLLRWNRKPGVSFDAELKATTIASQEYIRKAYQLSPTADNP
jgi:hypothetical protein